MAIKGDFISFTYNGVHSTDLGIVRVTVSNRYDDSLLPTIQDKTVQVPGSNGTYFFGSYYTQRQINVDFAFDEVTESQIRLMRRTFEGTRSHLLVFDEEPYKVYYSKVVSTPKLTYIPFGDTTVDGKRLYKGEGKLTFTCYDPFAHCPDNYKNYNEWIINSPIWYKYDNKDEWNFSAQLTTDTIYDTWDSSSKSFQLYNPGDLEADFFVILPICDGLTGIKIDNTNTAANATLGLAAGMEAKGEDTHIRFNSKLNIIEGLKYSESTGYTKTGNIYNSYINSGSWFKIPKTLIDDWKLTLINYNGTSASQDNDFNLIIDNFSLPAGSLEIGVRSSGDLITQIITKDSTTNEVVQTNIEAIGRNATISLMQPYEHNITITVTSKINNPYVPFIQYDYLYL